MTADVVEADRPLFEQCSEDAVRARQLPDRRRDLSLIPDVTKRANPPRPSGTPIAA